MKETSCGIVIFKEHNVREYLLLLHPGGHWDFAKGHMEEGETRHATALREAIEETGISDILILEGFQEKIEYRYMRDGYLREKEVFFFLGKAGSHQVGLSEEHTDYAWLPFAEAMTRLSFSNAKNLLAKAQIFLEEHG
jgi:bis(5'-nucleosidyl)-tetraphosphatase